MQQAGVDTPMGQENSDYIGELPPAGGGSCIFILKSKHNGPPLQRGQWGCSGEKNTNLEPEVLSSSAFLPSCLISSKYPDFIKTLVS